MTEDEFTRLAQTYGGDLARWPVPTRSEAAALARRSPRLGAVLQAELAFDGLLSTAVPGVTAERADAAMTAVAGAIGRSQVAASANWHLLRRAAPLGFAACALLGFALGFAASADLLQPNPAQETIALLAGGGSELGFLSR